MARVDQHPLPNLPWRTRVGASVLLLLGVVGFYGTVAGGVAVVDWGFSLGDLVHWGASLEQVRAARPDAYVFLAAAHAGAYLAVGAVVWTFFRRATLARGFRRMVGFVGAVLLALDVSAWLVLGLSGWAKTGLGVVVMLESVLLAWLVGRTLVDLWSFTRWAPAAPARVVVVGGGFAGLYTALGVDRRLGYHRMLELVLLDQRNFFLFPPLLPSVAAGSIESRQVTWPFRRTFEATNVQFRKETVDRIDLDRRVVVSRVDVDRHPVTGEVRAVVHETPYDYLVLAPGSDVNTWATPGVTEHAFFMREIGDAIAVRNQVIDCFERAAREADADRRQELLTFVIVGAGPTGVELAAEVRDLVDHILLQRYPEIGRGEVEVTLVQAAAQVLPGWHTSVVADAAARLQKIGVRLRLTTAVAEVGPFHVRLKSGELLPTRTCVWCAGVKAARLLAATGLPVDPTGRVPVRPDLRPEGHDNVFVVGDAAACPHQGRALPPLGQVAFQEGAHTADNLVRLLRGCPTRPFRYRDYGALVSVGEHYAAVDLAGVRLSGFFAWIVWRTLYLVKLVGFGNKLRVLLDWNLDLLVERSISQIIVGRSALPPAPDA